MMVTTTTTGARHYRMAEATTHALAHTTTTDTFGAEVIKSAYTTAAHAAREMVPYKPP